MISIQFEWKQYWCYCYRDYVVMVTKMAFYANIELKKNYEGCIGMLNLTTKNINYNLDISIKTKSTNKPILKKDK